MLLRLAIGRSAGKRRQGSLPGEAQYFQMCAAGVAAARDAPHTRAQTYMYSLQHARNFAALTVAPLMRLRQLDQGASRAGRW